MDQISSRWRKPKQRNSKKKQLATLKAMARWKNKKTMEIYNSSSADMSDVCVDDNVSIVKKNSPERFISNTLFSNENIPVASTSKMTDSSLTEMTDPFVNIDMTAIDKNCRSVKKLSVFNAIGCESIQNVPAYTIVHDDIWSDLLKNIICEHCSKKSLSVIKSSEFGYSTKLELSCTSCKYIFGNTFSSPRMSENKRFEVNKNMVEAFLNIGKGHSAMEIFSQTLGMQAMDRKTFDKYVVQLAEEGKILRDRVLDLARSKVRDAHKVFDSNVSEEDIIDIGVSYDGTWHKRGHSSLYGIGCVIDILTGLVIDFHVLSKYCHECIKTAADFGSNSAEFSIWFEEHKRSGKCEKNYEGSSGGMEVHAAEIMWKRSIADCNMQYTVMLSDGDSKTFINLSKLNIYNKPIVKEECVNHVAKRLGTALRSKVKEWKVKGVCLGGRKKGSLTEEVIVKLTNYYRKAIKDNAPNVSKMKSAIFASLYHSMSSNKKPQHQKCPLGEQSWCFYNRGLALGDKNLDHNKMKMKLSPDVVSKILPVYQRLASDELLMKCISGKTQNSNESVHSLIWKYCPKETFVSKKRIELAAILAISQFNMGSVAALKTRDKFLRSPSLSIAKKRDLRRLKQSIHRENPEYKQTYRFRKFNKNKKENKLNKMELAYAPGAF